MLSDSSSETTGLLPVLGCSEVLPVVMKFRVSLEKAQDKVVLLGPNIERHLRCVDDRSRLKVKLDRFIVLFAA